MLKNNIFKILFHNNDEKNELDLITTGNTIACGWRFEPVACSVDETFLHDFQKC